MAIQRSTKSLLIGVAATAAAIWCHCSSAAAQQRSDELRTLSATPMDIADGKLLAENTCAGCHGADGISVTEGIPHLAGQRPAYLYMELKAYQAGIRTDSTMGGVVKFL